MQISFYRQLLGDRDSIRLYCSINLSEQDVVSYKVSRPVSVAHLFSTLLLGLVKDAARPAYWVPDQDILSCHNCQREFTAKLSKHHCRACGQGVCDDCSPERRAVPSRGWDHPVRVCTSCNQKPGEL